jgi:hypothetical protein
VAVVNSAWVRVFGIYTCEDLWVRLDIQNTCRQV